jgi:hypothetical protein
LLTALAGLWGHARNLAEMLTLQHRAGGKSRHDYSKTLAVRRV